MLVGWAALFRLSPLAYSPNIYARLYIGGFYLCRMTEYYTGRIDARIVLGLGCKPGTRGGLAGMLGMSRDHVGRLVASCIKRGLVHAYYPIIPNTCWVVGCYMLTDKGKAYASQLARELGENEVQRLLTPKPRKGKRAPRIKLEGKNLADSLGL